MTNFEKYKDKLLEMVQEHVDIAVSEKTNSLCECNEIDCECCKLKNDDYACDSNIIKWLCEDVGETDWSKVPVDAKVRASNDGETWINRYFARYIDGVVYCWLGGASSFTASSDANVTAWKYVERVEE